MLEQIQAIRYVTPLREGGSLPGIVEADDDGTYVLKLRGAGQGVKVLVAEAIVGVDLIDGVLAQVPDEWPEPTGTMPDPEAVRTAYQLSLLARLDNPSAWLPRKDPS